MATFSAVVEIAYVVTIEANDEESAQSKIARWVTVNLANPISARSKFQACKFAETIGFPESLDMEEAFRKLPTEWRNDLLRRPYEDAGCAIHKATCASWEEATNLAALVNKNLENHTD